MKAWLRLGIVVLMVGSPLWAQLAAEPIGLQISPQATTRPALRWRLLPPAVDYTAGNAAGKYKAAAAALQKSLDHADGELLDELLEQPLAGLDAGRGAALLERQSGALALLEAGARMDALDWQSKVREEGIKVLLPHLGTCRTLCRLLAVGVRVDVARRDWPAAQRKLQTGLALGQHVGQGDTLVEALVGAGISAKMLRAAREWMSEPTSPNLYWALADLPRPFIDGRRALGHQRFFIDFMMPTVKRCREGRFDANTWADLVKDLAGVRGAMEPGEPGQVLTGVGAGLAFLPSAREYLKDSGFTPEEIQKMPIPEQLGRWFVGTCDETLDEVFKWHGLPIAAGPDDRAMERTIQEMGARYRNPLPGVLLPSLTRARKTFAQVDRQLVMMMAAEAIRHHSATTGRLPVKLTDVSLPILPDPLTGRALNYQLTETGARLWADDLPDEKRPLGPEFELRFTPAR